MAIGQPTGSRLCLGGATRDHNTTHHFFPWSSDHFKPPLNHSTTQPRSGGLAIFDRHFSSPLRSPPDPSQQQLRHFTSLFFPVHSIRQQPRYFSSPLRSPLHPTTAMALELKNDPGLGTSDGLRFASPRAAASVANRYLLTINVDPTALRALLDSKRQYASSFERFPKLPVEMQLQIWEHAARKGPTMMVIPFDDDRKVRKNYFLDDEPKWSGAALLGVCRLSRDVATRVCMTITHTITLTLSLHAILLLTRRTIKGVVMSATFPRLEATAPPPSAAVWPWTWPWTHFICVTDGKALVARWMSRSGPQQLR